MDYYLAMLHSKTICLCMDDIKLSEIKWSMAHDRSRQTQEMASEEASQNIPPDMGGSYEHAHRHGTDYHKHKRVDS